MVMILGMTDQPVSPDAAQSVPRPAPDHRQGRSGSIRLPALQHACLQAMGVTVPWILGARQIDHPSASDTVSGQGVHAQQAGPMALDTAPDISVIPPEIPVAPVRSQRGALSSDQPITPVTPATDDSSAGHRPSLQSLDLVALSEVMRTCDACADLCRSRKHVVPGQGSSNPRLMVIGEAPGEQEDLQGLPFVGPSGKLLDNMLAAIRLNRAENVFIANTIKCRPPANRNPREEEIRACSPFLERQIELLEPQAILAVGLFAAQTLLKSTAGVQTLRDKTHVTQIAGREMPVVVTFHPAYLLRRPQAKAQAWEDLKRIVKILGLRSNA